MRQVLICYDSDFPEVAARVAQHLNAMGARRIMPALWVLETDASLERIEDAMCAGDAPLDSDRLLLLCLDTGGRLLRPGDML